MPYSSTLPLIKNLFEDHLKSIFNLETSLGFGKGILAAQGFSVTNWCKEGAAAQAEEINDLS